MKKERDLIENLNPLGICAVIGLLLFILSMSMAIYKIATDRKAIDTLQRENSLLSSEVHHLQQKNKRR